MSSETKAYPQPVVDEINRCHVESWRDGKLMLQYCPGCEAYVFYPRPMCPDCWSDQLEWRQAAGRGRIISFSLVHRPNHEAFFDEVPIVLAEVMLQEGVSMLARIVCRQPENMESELLVELLPPGSASRFPLPTFRLLGQDRVPA